MLGIHLRRHCLCGTSRRCCSIQTSVVPELLLFSAAGFSPSQLWVTSIAIRKLPFTNCDRSWTYHCMPLSYTRRFFLIYLGENIFEFPCKKPINSIDFLFESNYTITPMTFHEERFRQHDVEFACFSPWHFRIYLPNVTPKGTSSCWIVLLKQLKNCV